MESSCEYV